MQRWSRARTHARTKDLLAALTLLLLTVVVALPSLHSRDIDDLDSAHHLMDGYFFRDLVVDHPHAHLQHYVFSYYKQYPALGFVFWPPLFPAVLGAFSLVGGAHVLTARACILFFGVVFALAFYAILRRTVPPWLALCATAAALTVPGIAWSLNEVMLELPTIAVMCLAVLAYLHLRDHAADPISIPRALLCAVALAAVIYTKQPGYFLYGAVALDLLVHPRALRKPETLLKPEALRKPEIWIAAAALALLCIPLFLFTLKFGHADLAQSVGSNTKLIMAHYDALPRWSVAAWTFYPRLAPTLLNPVIVLLTVGALVLALADAGFRRANALWLGWFLFAYLTFSFYDNRLPRHSTFWWPAWVALAAACLDWIAKRTPPKVARALPLFLLLPIPLQLARERHQDYTDYRDQRPIVAGLFTNGSPGNVLVFGADKQTFVALIREYDTSRQVHILRGDALLTSGLSLPDICRRYRVGTVLVQLPPATTLAEYPGLANLATDSDLQPGQSGEFHRRGSPITVLLFHYTGPIDPTMADVPLSDRLL